MINKKKERGWMILNGNYEKESEWILYIGESRSTVINYVVTNKKQKKLKG